MAMVLSSEADSSFERVGKCSAVMLDEWWRRVPSSRFLGFSKIEFGPRDGRDGRPWLVEGGEAERLKTLIFSSEPPVAR